MCLKSNIDERIQNLGFLRTTENPNYVFFYQTHFLGEARQEVFRTLKFMTHEHSLMWFTLIKYSTNSFANISSHTPEIW